MLPWHFISKLSGIKECHVRISTASMKSEWNCLFFFMGCSYLMNQRVIMKWLCSDELSGSLTLAGLLSTMYIIIYTCKKERKTLTFLVQLPPTMRSFICCRELSEECSFLLRKCQIPLSTVYSLQVDLCTVLWRLFVCLFLKRSIILRGKKKKGKDQRVNPLMLREAGCEAGICFRTRTNKMQACVFNTPRLKDSNYSLLYHR